MIKKQTITFLSNLKENNHKDWFEVNKPMYQEAHKNFLEFTQTLIDGLAAMDKGIGNSHLEPKKCVMRIYRDVRFSKDKTPYKSNFFAWINKAGKKSPAAGYYFNLEPGASFFGGGIYMPESKVLANIRENIDQHFEKWKKVANDKSLTGYFGEIKPSGKLSRPPKGFDPENPAIEWLKYKGFFTQKNLTNQELLDDQLLKKILSGYQAAKPLVDFINGSIEA
jgi:uncharacterized protein (TIGR02453 family)